MKSISSSFACNQRRPVRRSVKPATDDVIIWAESVVADPARYGATERERLIVADLLAQAEVSR